LDGFEASCVAAPAWPFDEDEEEEEGVKEEEELCVLLPELPAEPFRRCEEARLCWFKTTDENGAPALCPWECPGATLSANTTAPAATEMATARRNIVCAPNGRRRYRKLATDAPSAAIAGIREGSGMRGV
jgi:hypothetical protein